LRFELNEIQDLLVQSTDEIGDAALLGPAVGRENSEAEAEPSSVFFNSKDGNLGRRPVGPKGSKPVKGWVATVYVEDEVFLMSIDTGSSLTMIDMRAFFERFPLAQLQSPQGAF
jgi:hypothetical protein